MLFKTGKQVFEPIYESSSNCKVKSYLGYWKRHLKVQNEKYTTQQRWITARQWCIMWHLGTGTNCKQHVLISTLNTPPQCVNILTLKCRLQLGREGWVSLLVQHRRRTLASLELPAACVKQTKTECLHIVRLWYSVNIFISYNRTHSRIHISDYSAEWSHVTQNETKVLLQLLLDSNSLVSTTI